MSKRRDPRSPDEWRLATAFAEASLRLDSARLFGLVTGGPEIDVPRCLDILARGAARGCIPPEDAVSAAVHVLIAEYAPR